MATLHAHTHAALAGRESPAFPAEGRCRLPGTGNPGACPQEVRPHSPCRLPGPDVNWGARRPQFLGEDVHPHLYLSLEQRWVSWQGFLACLLSWSGSPVSGS